MYACIYIYTHTYLYIYLFIIYGDHRTSLKKRKWPIKFKMGAWARTGIYCHTINMNFISYMVISWIPVRPGWLSRWNRDLCVCHGMWVSLTCIGENSVGIAPKYQWFCEATTDFELSVRGHFMDSCETRLNFSVSSAIAIFRSLK